MAPFLGPSFEEAIRWALSGRRSKWSSRIGTALREFEKKESEGHCLKLRPLDYM